MRVVSSAEMRKIESDIFENTGFNERLIIENVGRSAADYLDQDDIIDHYTNEVIFLIGQGNNGADGLAIARHLANRRISTRAFLLFNPEDSSEVFQEQLKLAKSFGVRISSITSPDQLESYFAQTGGPFIIIDAILGIGTRLPLSNYVFEVINVANRYAGLMISVDIPTGISCDNGSMVGNAIKADITLAVGLPKFGHYIGSGAVHSGETIVIDGGLPTQYCEQGERSLLTIESVQQFHLDRNKFAHKNTFGHCLVVGGSFGLTGAANLTAMSALKVGTGLVTVSTWEECYGELCTRVIPEIMTGKIPTEEEEVEDTIKRLNQWDSIVVGPGIGRDKRSRNTVLQVLNHFSGPVIVDADAIRMLNFQEDKELICQRKAPTIFTPHMGEFASFIDVKVEKVLERPLEYLKEIIEELNCYFVMKGPASYLGLPDGKIYINYFPNDGMATAGSGDVLAGIIGGLTAQYTTQQNNTSPFIDNSIISQSLCTGLLLHSLSGKIAAEEEGVRSMTAGSIIKRFGKAFDFIEQGLDE